MGNYKKSTLDNVKNEIRELEKSKKFIEILSLLDKYMIAGYTCTKSTLKSEFGLKPKQIEMLYYSEVENPYYSSAAPMKLYLISQIKLLIKTLKSSKIMDFKYQKYFNVDKQKFDKRGNLIYFKSIHDDKWFKKKFDKKNKMVEYEDHDGNWWSKKYMPEIPFPY